MTKPNSKSGRSTIERCSFCGKTRRMVESLIAGPPGVYICNECIDLCNTILNEEHPDRGHVAHAPTATASSSSRTYDVQVLDSDTLPTPAEIKAELDKFVIGQSHAKKVMSVAVYNHYRRLISREEPAVEGDDVILEKSNILLVGPTGSGKTLLARTLAKMLNVPFAISDATTLTAAGYVGEDVENLLLKLLQAADFDLKRAERGIIFLDEVDKIGRTSNNVSITRDVSGEGVQQTLLKMLEGTISNVPPQGGRKHPEQSYIQFNTENVLFICGGTFVGLHEIIAKRLGKQAIGFKTDQDGLVINDADAQKNELFPLVEPSDLVTFGMIPELIGRLPVISTLEELDVDSLSTVLTEPKNAIVRQFKRLFELEGTSLEFTTEALRAVALKCITRKTGARGLRAVIEAFMLEPQFQLPNVKDKAECYYVTKDVVDGKVPLLECVTPEGPAAVVAKATGKVAKAERRRESA